MANFIEFLKSGKSAREFIDTSVLPQHVLPVEKTETSPEPYENDAIKEEDESPDNDPLDEAVENMTDKDWESLDEKYDASFLEALETAEQEGLDDEDDDSQGEDE